MVFLALLKALDMLRWAHVSKWCDGYDFGFYLWKNLANLRAKNTSEPTATAKVSKVSSVITMARELVKQNRSANKKPVSNAKLSLITMFYLLPKITRY